MSVIEENFREEQPKKKLSIFKKYKYAQLTPLWISVFIDIIGFSMITPLSDYFLKTYQTTSFIVGWVLGTNAIFTLIFAPILGRLSDKFGRKPLLLISQFGTFTAFLILAFSTSLEMVLLSRVVDGIFGGNYPIAKAIISDVVPPEDRPVQMTNIGVCHVLASLIGPGLGGVLSLWGTLASGLVAAILSLFTMIITIFILQESWPEEIRLKTKKEKMKLKVRKNKNAMFFLTQYGFHDVAFITYVSTFVLFASIALGLSGFETGIMLMISGIFRATIRFTVFKPLLNKLGVNNTLKLGLSMFVVVFFLVIFVNHWIQAFILLLFASFAASCTRGILNSKISQSVPPKYQGKINGYSSSLDSLAQFIGPIFGGFLLWIFEPYWLGIFICLISLLPLMMVFNKITFNRHNNE